MYINYTHVQAPFIEEAKLLKGWIIAHVWGRGGPLYKREKAVLQNFEK